MIEIGAALQPAKLSLPEDLMRQWPTDLPLPGFADAEWDLSPLVPSSQRRDSGIVRFDPREDPEVTAALRDFLHVRLNCASPPHRTRLSPTNLTGTFYRARFCLRFIKAELGVVDFRKIEQLHLDRFLKQLIEEGRSSIAISHHVVIWQDLHLFDAKLAGGGLRFFPWSGRSTRSVSGSRRARLENRTNRIPEHVIETLLFWALRYVEDFSNDILAARDELLRLQLACQAMSSADCRLSQTDRHNVRRNRVLAFISHRRESGKGMPIWTTDDGRYQIGLGKINCQFVGLFVGDPEGAWVKNHYFSQHLKSALEELGAEAAQLDLSYTQDEYKERLWRDGCDEVAILRECRLLQTACYIVCAYLTGMRDCEVQSMTTGCLSTVRSKDGLIERYIITAELGKVNASDKPLAKWVAIEPVASAVRVLERLHERSVKGKLWKIVDGIEVEGGYETISYGINRYLKIFSRHIEKVFEADLRGSDGIRWRFTSRQFRRTMAWHIARRPFGVIAGKIQYQHASVAAFEGYAGASASGFRAEVETEIAIGRLESVLEYYSDNNRGLRMFGPAAPRLKAMFTDIREKSKDPSGIVADDARIRTLLKSPARTLHIGLLSDCFFDADKALCLKGLDKSRARPIAALCSPTRCANSCIGERHIQAWQLAREHARDALKVRGLSKVQREVIQADLDVIQSVIREAGEE